MQYYLVLFTLYEKYNIHNKIYDKWLMPCVYSLVKDSALQGKLEIGHAPCRDVEIKKQRVLTEASTFSTLVAWIWGSSTASSVGSSCHFEGSSCQPQPLPCQPYPLLAQGGWSQLICGYARWYCSNPKPYILTQQILPVFVF